MGHLTAVTLRTQGLRGLSLLTQIKNALPSHFPSDPARPGAKGHRPPSAAPSLPSWHAGATASRHGGRGQPCGEPGEGQWPHRPLVRGPQGAPAVTRTCAKEGNPRAESQEHKHPITRGSPPQDRLALEEDAFLGIMTKPTDIGKVLKTAKTRKSYKL